MFAGPNGSGKSTLKSLLRPELIGVYLNPDELEQQMSESACLDLEYLGVTTTTEEAKAFFRDSALLRKAGSGEFKERIHVTDRRLCFPQVEMNSYWSAAAAEFLREKLLRERRSFTIETVMSHPGKVELLERAQAMGYRTYLYFVATEDPEINVARVASRVRKGGHAVPEEKIVSRYHATLGLLPAAIHRSNRAFLFDNTGRGHTWFAEVSDGQTLKLKTQEVPRWFANAVLNKVGLNR